MSSLHHSGNLYKKLGLVTLFFLFSLILIGGIVRTTGAGMGCPDWPKCFGSWVPPTDVSQLPDDYQEIYKDRGYASMEFNVVRTWIEYANRLFGALTGLVVFATFIASFPYLKKDKMVFYLSLAAFFLVSFEGWLGAQVVASNLAHHMITIHLMLAFLIVATVIYALLRANEYSSSSSEDHSHSFKPLLFITIPAIIITLIQVVMGTLVREEVTEFTKLLPTAENWLVNNSSTLPVHRSMAWLVIASSGLLIYKIFRDFRSQRGMAKAALGIGAVVIAQIFTGILLTYFGFPAFAQALHILLAALLFSIQVFVLGAASLALRETEQKNLSFEFSLK